MASHERDNPDIAVIGAGPAGLMAAETAVRAGARVTICDSMPSVGRKFLMAGRSGLNITHSEPFERFLQRYGAAADWLHPMLERFSPQDMRDFCTGLGVETFVGSSGRVFPREMKASPLLRAWLRRLADAGVRFRMRTRLVGIAEHGEITLETAEGRETVRVGAIVLALGGASWPRLGSTGEWTSLLMAKGVELAPFRPSNCGLRIAWSDALLRRFEGEPIKTACFSFGAKTARGEAVVTKRGLEGGAIYALASAIGAALRAGEQARLSIDLKPDASAEAIEQRLQRRRKGDSFSNGLRKSLGLSPLAIALLRESAPDAQSLDARALSGLVKNVQFDVVSIAGLERAISTAGGVRRDEIDEHLMLRKSPGVFVAGEMIDWDAPTGGYLLQACFATGREAGAAAARFALTR